MTGREARADASGRGRRPLRLVNFFMADLQAGVGPFLGVYLLAHGWQPGLIGTITTIAGVIGVLMTAPAGAFVDATRFKRACVVVSATSTVVASALILLSQSLWVVTAAQVATAIAGAAIVPTITGITLGIVGQEGFDEQNGQNQAFNHAGNLVGAAMSGLLGWQFGLPAVFCLAAVFGVLTVCTVLAIPANAIDHDAARGAKQTRGGNDREEEKVSGLSVLLECRPLLVLAAAIACFHLGNGAMLTLYGFAVVTGSKTDPAVFTATTIMVAQGVMTVASLAAVRLIERSGYWPVLLIAFAALPARALVAANLIGWWGLLPVQLLDGIGGGLLSVAVPGMVARILNETGRVNVGQGTILMVQGLGASLSPALGGWLAQVLGYGPAFLALGSLAIPSLLLWLAFSRSLRAASKPEDGDQPASRAQSSP